MFEKLEKKYFDRPLSQGFVSLYAGKTIIMIASALLGIFLPIFLYNLFNNNFQAVFIYYGIGFFLYGLFISVGVRFLNSFGFRKALQTSVILGALFYAIFYVIEPHNMKYLIPLSILVLTFYRIFYWLPYHIDFAKFTDKKSRGRQFSFIKATRMFLGIFIPLIAGFIIMRFGFDILFLIAVILFLLSGIPYFAIPRTKEKFSWSWSETWRQFFSKKRRRLVVAYSAYGAENVVGVIVWPIFIYQLLQGNYFQVGVISTFIIGITVILQLILGFYMDLSKAKGKVLGWGSIFYSLGWLVKIFIATAFQIFVVGLYHSVAEIFIRTPFNVLNYELAADQGHYVDEFTVLREMAVNFGKTAMSIIIIYMSFIFAIQWVFLLAALTVIVFNLIRGQEQIRLASID